MSVGPVAGQKKQLQRCVSGVLLCGVILPTHYMPILRLCFKGREADSLIKILVKIAVFSVRAVQFDVSGVGRNSVTVI